MRNWTGFAFGRPHTLVPFFFFPTMRRSIVALSTRAAHRLLAGTQAIGVRTIAGAGGRARSVACGATHLAPAPTRGFAASPSARYDDDDDVDDVVLYPAPAAVVGEQAPRWSAPALVGGELTKVSLDQYLKEGKYVCLFFYPKGKGKRGKGKGGGGWRGTTSSINQNNNKSPPLLSLSFSLSLRLYLRLPHRDHRLQRPRRRV